PRPLTPKAKPNCGASIAARAARDAPRFGFAFGVNGRGVSAGVFFRRAVAQIGHARGEEFLCRRAVSGHALGLVKRPFVPVQAKPSQLIENALHQFGTIAFGVGVFYAEDEDATLVAGEQPVKECSASAADMQVASG